MNEEIKKNLKPIIKSIGVGGGGCNATAYMSHSEIEGVEFLAANTDAQDLEKLHDGIRKIQLGAKLTNGLGAGANPDIGRLSAEENEEEIRNSIEGANMLFISAGMGGGTGTGAAPVIAKIAKDMGMLVIAVVTKPFNYERAKRMNQAMAGLEALSQYTDSLIIIPNDRLRQVIPVQTPMGEVFEKVDQVLYEAIQGIAEIITKRGMINIDFNDLKTVMSNSGNSMIGMGIAEGENKAVIAAEEAIRSPLLENDSLSKAKRAVVNISLSVEGSLEDFEAVGEVVKTVTAEDAEVIMGFTINEELANQVKVTIIFTDFETEAEEKKKEIEEENKRAEEAAQIESTSSKLPGFVKRGSKVNIDANKTTSTPNKAIGENDKKDLNLENTTTTEESKTGSNEEEVVEKKIPQFLKKKLK